MLILHFLHIVSKVADNSFFMKYPARFLVVLQVSKVADNSFFMKQPSRSGKSMLLW